MRIRKITLCLLLYLALAGCIIESRQLKALKAFVSRPAVDLSSHLWELRFSGYHALVNAVEKDGRTFFVNENSDFLEFDGWMIIEVQGLRQFFRPWKIVDVEDQRNFYTAGQVRVKHQCESWNQRKDDQSTIFSQTCLSQQSYTNTVLVDSLGRISHIKQVIDDSGNFLSLRLMGN